ncbi:MAG: Ig-like domain-containing protein [Prevotella sp.]|nr:Ig-like domain-containing protein [Prevotella sp.]
MPSTLISEMRKETYPLIPLTFNYSNLKPELTWHSSNPSVATVSTITYNNETEMYGIVTAKNIGYTTITCTASNGVTSNKCEVFVYSMSLEPVYEVGLWETLKLTPIITPSSSYTINPYVTWRSTDGEIAKVDKDGIVTPINIGQCKIIMTNKKNQRDTCIVKVLDNYLSIDSAIGVPSGTLVLPIRLNNTSNITGMQYELQLPDGVSVAQDKSGNLLASLSDRVDDQMITGSRLSNGNYQFVVFSKNSKPLLGNEGAIAYVTLKISPDMAIGDYSIGMKNIELTTPTGKAIYNMDKSAKLTIDDVKMGDVNGDGRVTVTDAVCIVNYIHERYPSVFIDKAADVNGDGSITITDAVGIINMIQNQ